MDTSLISQKLKFTNKRIIKLPKNFICLTLNSKQFKKFFCVVKSAKHTIDSRTDDIKLHVYDRSLYTVTLSVGLLGHCESNITVHPEKAYINKINFQVSIFSNPLNLKENFLMKTMSRTKSELTINNKVITF